MSLTTRIKSLESRVKRLEATAGKGQRCARCRLTLRNSWPDQNKLKLRPENLARCRCEFCHLEYTISLDSIPIELREGFRLYYSFSLEDQYTNPKAHALQLWMVCRPDQLKRQEYSTIAKPRINKGGVALAKLREEAGNLIERKRERLKAKYGEQPFPEQLQIIELVQNRERNNRTEGAYVPGLSDLEQKETVYLICSELEKIIWGNTTPETASAIGKIEREIDELINATKKAKEPTGSKNLDLINRNRARLGRPPLRNNYGLSR